MAALPTPSGSDGTYGDELNEYLLISHAADGKIKDGAVFTTSAAPTVDAGVANKKYVDDSKQAYIKLHDSKTAGTPGGTFTSGDWRKRTVTELTDTDDNVTVSSSVIVLQAGTYDCLITCPGYSVNSHKTRLYNTTGATTIIIGSNNGNSASLAKTDDSLIRGRFTIAASQNLEIQHRCSLTKTNDGFGLEVSFGENEVYTVAEFWKV